MKEKYVGKVKVPFCVKNDESQKVPEVFYEILDFPPQLTEHSHEYYNYCYFGVCEEGSFDYWWDIGDFGENTTVYTLEELQAIIDEVNKGEEVGVISPTSDGYVGIASGETVSTDSVGSPISVKTNVSFDVVIKGILFTLTPDELKELYIQCCKAEGVLKEWSLDE